MVVEISGAEMFFQAISRTGQIVDSGAIQRRRRPRTAPARGPERSGGRVVA